MYQIHWENEFLLVVIHKTFIVKRTILSLFFVIISTAILAQISVTAIPVSTLDKMIKPPVSTEISAPKMISRPQIKNPNQPLPLSAGQVFSVNPDILSRGTWQKSTSGIYVWQLAVHVPDAHALSLYFKNFALQSGDKLFIYNSDKSEIIGAFTAFNNGKYFATGIIQGSEIIIELNSKTQYQTLPFELVQIGNISGSTTKSTANFGDAGSCEVPVNCAEGNNYQNQKRGVARILVKSGNGLFWCTGSLINDTKHDGTPFFLTANHCGANATASDYQQWIFYFNFESPDCSRPSTPPPYQSMSGASLLASAVQETSLGSDFMLLKLNNDVPYSYNPYYNGWDATGTGSTSGVTIHHPEGDIKMISTYTTPLVPVNYGASTQNTNGLYWQVYWAQTIDGHGVTEGGSSGSPLLNSQGLIIGELTGGGSSCSTLTSPDYYGRFSQSWDKNGTDSTRQLKYWLDNMGTGVLQMSGYDPFSVSISPFFSSNIQTIPIGGKVQFVDLSTGPIVTYHWVFEGGNPASSDLKDPPEVKYSEAGNYSVSLTVTGNNDQKTKTINGYISVRPVLYPNPVRKGKINLLLGAYNENDVKIEVYNLMGQKINYSTHFTSNSVEVFIPDAPNGLFIVKLTNNKTTQVYKVMNLHK